VVIKDAGKRCPGCDTASSEYDVTDLGVLVDVVADAEDRAFPLNSGKNSFSAILFRSGFMERFIETG
jgi:hypothetical protein